jgi:Zn-dependent peptidase ImmA (M78 family)
MEGHSSHFFGKLEVHYNPLRPKIRIKFSIAHEVAHSLFPDCTEAIRHRGARFVEREDEWQLEILCNLAAGELLMPIGSFQDFNQDRLAIDRVIHQLGHQLGSRLKFQEMARHFDISNTSPAFAALCRSLPPPLLIRRECRRVLDRKSASSSSLAAPSAI